MLLYGCLISPHTLHATYLEARILPNNQKCVGGQSYSSFYSSFYSSSCFTPELIGVLCDLVLL